MALDSTRYAPGVYIVENSVSSGTSLEYIADDVLYYIDDRASVTINIEKSLRASTTLNVFRIGQKARNIINVAYNT